MFIYNIVGITVAFQCVNFGNLFMQFLKICEKRKVVKNVHILKVRIKDFLYDITNEFTDLRKSPGTESNIFSRNIGNLTVGNIE